MTGSNRRPPACKAGALPAELIPRVLLSPGVGYLVGLVGLEPTTPALSRRCSNQLSYRPGHLSFASGLSSFGLGLVPTTDKCGRSILVAFYGAARMQPVFPCMQGVLCCCCFAFSRKEVIQPHLPIRLPCYDFTPVTNPAVVSALLTVRLPTSGRTRSHGVTGGVYKTRERIHRDMLIHDY